MPRLSAAPITLTPEQEADLRGLARAHKTPRKLAERAEMILRSTAGTEVREIARQLGVWPKTVRRWAADGCPARRRPRLRRGWRINRDRGRRRRLRPSRSARSWRWPANHRKRAASCRSVTGARANWPARRSGAASSTASRTARSALFKKRPTSNHISCAAGSRPSRTLSSRANAPRFARSIMRRLRLGSTASARCRSTK